MCQGEDEQGSREARDLRPHPRDRLADPQALGVAVAVVALLRALG